MPLSEVLSEKWDARLYAWLLWRTTDSSPGEVQISAVYRGLQFGIGYRELSGRVLVGEVMDTDELMTIVRQQDRGIHDALVQWTLNNGTRGQQAARLSIHHNTLANRVDAGKQWLEQLQRDKRRRIENVTRAL